jgi:hypothetical protein
MLSRIYLDKGALELIQHRATGWTTSVQFAVASEAFLSSPLLPHWLYGPPSLLARGTGTLSLGPK